MQKVLIKAEFNKYIKGENMIKKKVIPEMIT